MTDDGMALGCRRWLAAALQLKPMSLRRVQLTAVLRASQHTKTDQLRRELLKHTLFRSTVTASNNCEVWVCDTACAGVADRPIASAETDFSKPDDQQVEAVAGLASRL